MPVFRWPKEFGTSEDFKRTLKAGDCWSGREIHKEIIMKAGTIGSKDSPSSSGQQVSEHHCHRAWGNIEIMMGCGQCLVPLNKE